MTKPTLLACLLLPLAGCICAFGWQPPEPSGAVSVLRQEWRDETRNRNIPVTIYYPSAGSGPFPVIIFSHGLGGTRDGYSYLGSYWAGCGFIVVHLQHHGSDDLVWRDIDPVDRFAVLRKAAANPINAVNRADDVSNACDQLARLNVQSKSPLYGKMNLSAMGIAGHSFGGWTTMAIAGERFGPLARSFADPRFKAAIAMSAPVTGAHSGLNKACMDIFMPVFFMTGTLDDSPIGETKAPDRRLLFDGMARSDALLLTLNGADHMTFTGHLLDSKNDQTEHFHSLICLASTAFWEAFLCHNEEARHWLYDGGCASLIGSDGSFEKKTDTIH